jgi:uncharacterized RDD family membrane protein YckC
MNRYRTFWPRVGATFIDAFVFMPLFVGGQLLHLDTAGRGVSVAWNIALSLGPIVYSIWMHYRFGQTLGKMATGVVVMDVSEKRTMTFGQSCLRDSGWFLLTICDLVVELSGARPSPVKNESFAAMDVAASIWAAVELVTMLSSDKRRALHDWLAGSVVVKKLRHPP